MATHSTKILFRWNTFDWDTIQMQCGILLLDPWELCILSTIHNHQMRKCIARIVSLSVRSVWVLYHRVPSACVVSALVLRQFIGPRNYDNKISIMQLLICRNIYAHCSDMLLFRACLCRMLAVFLEHTKTLSLYGAFSKCWYFFYFACRKVPIMQTFSEHDTKSFLRILN